MTAALSSRTPRAAKKLDVQHVASNSRSRGFAGHKAEVETLLDDGEKRKATPIRPGTLAQVLHLVRSGEKLRFCMAGFLDDFYGDVEKRSRLRRVSEDPGPVGDARLNALMGAIGEHLVRRWGLGDPPSWTTQPERFLDRPW